MRQQKQWVATFNGASARAFTFNGVPRALAEIADARRQGRHKPDYDDRATRVHSSLGDRRSGASAETDPERRLEDEFVERLVDYLETRRLNGDFDELIVAAAARALGAFRKAAGPALAKSVVREIHGDHVNSDIENLREALALD
jgi:protein required for attachment to host cells